MSKQVDQWMPYPGPYFLTNKESLSMRHTNNKNAPFHVNSSITGTVLHWMIPDKVVSFMRANSFYISQSQWTPEYNELVKRLPLPYDSLRIRLNWDFSFTGILCYVSDSFHTYRNTVEVLADAEELCGDDVIKLAKLLLKKAKQGVAAYHRDVLKGLNVVNV